MFGPLPRHPQAAEGHTNGFIADEPWGEPLGDTDLGGQRERPPTRRLAECAWTLVQQRPQGLAGTRVEERGGRVGAGRGRLQRRKTALVERMQCVAHCLSGAAQVVRKGGRRLALGPGEEDLAAAYGKGGRGPEAGLEGCPLVRQERAYT